MKEAVILECAGKTTSEYGELDHTVTYRINGAANTFETWDGEQFRRWEGGELIVSTSMIVYSAEWPKEDFYKREASFDRISGNVSESTYFRSNKNSSEFKGECEAVEEGKPEKKKF